MELKDMSQKAIRIFKKYRYAVLIFLVGFLLMIIPIGQKKAVAAEPIITATHPDEYNLEERLQRILSSVAGAGEVQVVLTISAGEEILYQTNEDKTEKEKDISSQLDTVIIEDSQRSEAGLIKQIIPAEYQGAIIVCQGAEDPVVRLAIVDAVSKLTGLGANCISVLKMK